MNFRKRIKLFPGFHLNISTSGISSTIGIKGASFNFSKNGTYLNAGIPGTGFYHRKKLRSIQSKKSSSSFSGLEQPLYHDLSIGGEIKSADAQELTSGSMVQMKESLLQAYIQRKELSKDIASAKSSLTLAWMIYLIACLLIVGFFIPWLRNYKRKKKMELMECKENLANCFVPIDVYFDETCAQKYKQLVQAYQNLLTSQRIWDITAAIHQDPIKSRSTASRVVTRTPVSCHFNHIDIMQSTHPAFHFGNKNGGDLYIYPAFVLITTSNQEFGLIDIHDFNVEFSYSRFLEEDKIPSDSQIVSHTWAKVNKNGMPDKRFKDNYQIPIVQYGNFNLTSSSGLNESYSFSHAEYAAAFAQALQDYKKTLSNTKW